MVLWGVPSHPVKRLVLCLANRGIVPLAGFDHLRSFANRDALGLSGLRILNCRMKILTLVEEAEARGIAIYRSGIVDGSIR